VAVVFALYLAAGKLGLSVPFTSANFPVRSWVVERSTYSEKRVLPRAIARQTFFQRILNSCHCEVGAQIKAIVVGTSSRRRLKLAAKA
jgi:hypothetical protein